MENNIYNYNKKAIDLELDKLSFDIRLFETELKCKLKSENPNMSYYELISKINFRVQKKFGERREELLKNLWQFR